MSSRLVDYFIIIGYDESSSIDSKNFGQGKVLWQCPPVLNNKSFWDDSYSFPHQLAKMCMPLGWRSSSIYQEPTYFCSQLTSETALDITFACFTMYEPILQTADDTLMPREEMQSARGDTYSVSSGEDVVYCPKCLILLSSHRYPETFKQILCQLYNVGMREASLLERCDNIQTAVANLIGYTDVPSPRSDKAITQQFQLLQGLPQLSFIVPKDTKVPVTGKSVLELFNCLGTSNALAIVIAVLAGAKVILSSISFSKMTECIHAVISLLYPLQVEHEGSDGRPVALMSTVRVPVLPHEILRYVNSPFPYIYGVHSSLMEEMRNQCDSDLSDILIADLDSSHVQLPKDENDLCLPDRVQAQVLSQLQLIMDPQLQDRDKAFPPNVLNERSNSSADLLNSGRRPETIDKQIRAVFMQLLAHIMHKYRQCLVVVRVHPNPVLKLDKFSFMKARPDLDKAFLEKFLNDNMLFNNFIEARGSPYRSVDLMDHMIDSDNLETFCSSKNFSKNADYESIEDLAKILAANETPSTPQSMLCVNPSRRWDVNYVFPVNLNTEKVAREIRDGVSKRQTGTFTHSSAKKYKQSEFCVVPGTVPGEAVARSLLDLDAVGNSTTGAEMQLPAVKKRLDGLEKCIQSIFDGRISDVYSGLDASRKILNSTLSAKRLLVYRLREHANDAQNDTMRPVELNVRLLHFLAQLVNEALVFEDGTEIDHDIVRGVLSIASCYYSNIQSDHRLNSLTSRRLTIQNFSQIQQHMAKTQTATFANMVDIECPQPTRLPHQYLCTLIQGHPVWHSHQFWIHAFYLDVEKQLHKMYARFGPNGEKLPDNRTTIERLADQLKEKQNWRSQYLENGFSDEERLIVEETRSAMEQKRRLLVGSEQQNAFSQALDYLTQIVQLQMPLKTPVYRSRMSSKTYSSKSGGGESGSTGRDEDDQVTNESSPGEIEKFLVRFLQDAMESTECGKDYAEKAEAELQNIMEQQQQTLSEIYTAAKEGDDSAFYPQKFRPVLLPKEEYITTATEIGGEDGLPIRLLADLKTLTNPLNADLPYLPANGNVYLTNYRLIVIAHPRPVLTCDQLIHKSFPISMLLKMERVEEKIRGESTSNASKEVTFHRKVWQFVFANFQVMRIVFDADIAAHVSDKRAEAFVESVKELRRCGDNYNYAFMPAYLYISTGGTATSSNREPGYPDGREHAISKPKSKTANTLRSSTRRLLSMPKTIRGTIGGGLGYNPLKKNNLGLTLPSTNELDDDFMADDGFPIRGSSLNGGLSSTQTLERLEKTRLVQDYLRLHLGSSLNDSGSHASSWGGKSTKHKPGVGDFKISTVNAKYECCETYPAALVIPASVNDGMLAAVKPFYRTHRFPVITWRDKRNGSGGCLLIRASCLINSRNMFQPFKKSSHHPRRPSVASVEGTATGIHGSAGERSGPIREFREYIRTLIDVIPKPVGWIDNVLSSPNPHMKRSSRSSSRTSSEFMSPDGYTGSPKKYGKMGKLANRVTHNLGTLTHGFGGSGTIAAPKSKSTLSVPKRLFLGGLTSGSSSSSSQANGVQRKKGQKTKLIPMGNMSDVTSDLNDLQLQSSSMYESELSPGSDTSSLCSQSSLPFSFATRTSACLFIFVGDIKDKKNPFLNIGPAAEVVPVEVLSSSKLRDSFASLMNALASADAPKRTGLAGDLSAPGSSKSQVIDKWLQQVSKLLHVTMQVVTVMSQGKSVMLCLEDHNDMTAQVISLVQLLMDPEYRTVDGFCTLLDKEWLSFGHRFKYKTGQFDFPTNGFCPTFLLFLDAVYQALLQHPTMFEFNCFFLQTIAYHHMSNRFPTFLGNSDLDRIRLQAALFDHDPAHIQEGRESLWTFVNSVHNTNPCFINYNCSTYKDFSGASSNPDCLLLNWSGAALELWPFYLPESLTDANLYELDLEPNPRQPEQKNFLTGSGLDSSSTSVQQQTSASSSERGEAQQSLVNAAVSPVTLQDEISLSLKRAVDHGITGPNSINHYYRSRCPQKRPHLINAHAQSLPISMDNLIKDLAYKSLSVVAATQKTTVSSAPNPSGNSASNLNHQMVAVDTNLEHCELCKQRVSSNLPGLTCTSCDLVLHKTCTQWNKSCKKRKDSQVNSAMVKSDSFTYRGNNGQNGSHVGELVGTNSNRESYNDGSGSPNRNSSTLKANSQSLVNEARGGLQKSDTISKWSNRVNRNLERVLMYKQTRHLRQWKKQMLEYNHSNNMLRFADPHGDATGAGHQGSTGGAGASGKYKEIQMNSILRVEIKSPRSLDIVLPNHFEGFSLIRMELLNREYFLLVRDREDAEKWVDLLSNRIAD